MTQPAKPTNAKPPSAIREYEVLPMDQVYEVRRKMLRRLWRELKKPGPGAEPPEPDSHPDES